jgi:uncharacterized RDD family membrane protein YckC
MTQPAGWYDDPQDPTQLRYWDGVIWSSNVTPKVSPTVEQSTIGMPYGVTPAAARPEGAGSYGAQGVPSASGGLGSPQDQGQQDGQWPAYGQHPGYLPTQQGWQSNPVPSTPDGVPLSGWWKRVLARFLDGIIIFIATLPLTFVPLRRVVTIFMDVMQQSWDAAQRGSSTAPQVSAALTEEMNGKIALVSLIGLAFFVVYEITFLALIGATPGKMAVGISVRLRDEPGPPPLVAVLKRTFVKEGPAFIESVPVLGFLLGLFSLLNVLWPLWDSKKQALHDKVAKTNVVVGSQPKRRS